MHTFALERLRSVSARQDIFRLWNGERCEWKEFVEELKSNPKYLAEFAMIQERLKDIGNLEYSRLPPSKWKQLKGGDGEYEIRTKNLRGYHFKITGGQVLVFIGLKADQVKDLKRMRRIKSAVEDQIMNGSIRYK